MRRSGERDGLRERCFLTRCVKELREAGVGKRGRIWHITPEELTELGDCFRWRSRKELKD